MFAASSLSEAFGALEQRFEADHPGVDVRLNTAGSQVLRLQIEHGAQADVFASANLAHVDALERQGLAVERALFASNRLVVAVPPDNPADIQRFEDLARASQVVLGAPTVPAGAYADALLDRSDPELARAVRGHIVSREPNVRLVLAKVALGEADAAIVYASDVVGRADVHAVAVPDEMQPPIVYPVVLVTTGRNPRTARAWMALLRSDAGQDTLARAGFGGAP